MNSASFYLAEHWISLKYDLPNTKFIIKNTKQMPEIPTKNVFRLFAFCLFYFPFLLSFTVRNYHMPCLVLCHAQYSLYYNFVSYRHQHQKYLNLQNWLSLPKNILNVTHQKLFKIIPRMSTIDISESFVAKISVACSRTPLPPLNARIFGDR